MTTEIPRKLDTAGRGPAPLGTQKSPGRGALAEDARSVAPPPTPCTPLPDREPALPRRAGRSRAVSSSRHRSGSPREGKKIWGSSGHPRAEAAGGSIRYYTWGRRRTGQRRPRRLEAEARAEEEVPGTPPSHCPGPRPAAARSARPGALPVPGSRCWPLPCSGRLFPPLMLLIPGTLGAGPGSEPTDKK